VVLALKLVLTPAVMVGATLAGRRWGGAVSGWLIGLPLTSGPLVFIIALEHGRHFASRTATGSLSGCGAEAAFCVGWLAGSRRSRRVALACASAAFAVAAVLVHPLPYVALVPLALASLLVALRILPPFAPRTEASVRTPRWDLSTRALVALAIVLVLTAAAPTIGARLTGLLAVYPLYSAVLAVFSPAVAIGILRGLLLGLFSFVAFYAVLAPLLAHTSTGVAFSCAIAAALVTQSATARNLRPRASRSERDLPPVAAS
jgi:hypothetical protein